MNDDNQNVAGGAVAPSGDAVPMSDPSTQTTPMASDQPVTEVPSETTVGADQPMTATPDTGATEDAAKASE